MSVSLLRITYFQADKILNMSSRRVGELQKSAPYRITTYRGPELGLIGVLPAVLYKMYELNSAQAANCSDQEYSSQPLLQRLQQCLSRR